MTDPLGVDVGERSEQLVDVELDFQDGHGGLHLVKVARCPIDGLWDVLQHQVEVDFIFLLHQDG
jgi:hypothetical protein